jgi:hypothetical protein
MGDDKDDHKIHYCNNRRNPMTKRMIKSLTMLTIVAALSLASAVMSADAQTSTKLVANIPFEFVVGNNEMAAGQYDVDRITSGGMAIRIRDSKTGKSSTRLTSPIVRTTAPERGKLVFHKYGNSYFLAEIWRAGDNNGRKLVKSSLERNAQRELASNATPRNERKYEVVEVMFAGQ